MRLRNIPGAVEYIAESKFTVDETSENKGNWCNNIFHNDNPLHIEIGMGKGKFITELAQNNPDVNYIGMDRYASVLIKAVHKLEEHPLDNIRFMRTDALRLCEYFGSEEISKIYLNFSDPWPKDRHAKRRLTSPRFLQVYHDIIKHDGRLEFKTDNTSLFDYSLETINESDLWELCEYTYDLHNEPKLNEGNIMTEYEAKFSANGNPIHKLIAKPIF